jgi:SpoVK/Ycf46/Vps4 family AAA+-type ATPase
MTPKNKIKPSVDTYLSNLFPDKYYDQIDLVGLKQFTTSDYKKFYPASSTVPCLTPGVYDIEVDNMKGLYFKKINVKTDGLIKFPETNSEKVIEEISKFWDRESIFKKYNLNYKRGIFLYGPPGSGKSSTIQLICEDVISRNGVVFNFTNPGLFCDGVRTFREIQPETPIVVLMEDIDSIVESYNESEILNILDGINQVEKIVYLATTNYPERLGQRILNRPSRFDKRFKMGHPQKDSRKIYFSHLISTETKNEHEIDIDKWVEDTEDMSIAHLKELFISVCILGNSYQEAISTLRKMIENKISSSDDNFGKMGFSK